MILRKPYAFLIKHFKLIHLFITSLIVYLIIKTSNILSFFKDYINNDILEFTVFNYVNSWIFLSIIVIIGLVITMVVLMRKKDKPLLFYILTICGYSILFIGFAYINSILTELEFNLLDRKTIVFVRDITRFMLIGQFLLLIPYIIRGLGFDIKKFDFKSDLQQLDISVEDNEEFELLSPINIDDVHRRTRKRLRELKYYYIENKLFILIIISVIVFSIFVFIFNSVDLSSLKRYKENEIINLENYYTLKFEDSYITTRGDNGKIIANNNNFYLIVKFTINSMYNGKISLNINKFVADIDNNDFVPIRTHYNYFSSYGIGYKNQTLLLNDNKTYILVYDIPNKYIDEKIRLEYNYRYDSNDTNKKMIKKIVNLEPEIKN